MTSDAVPNPMNTAGATRSTSRFTTREASSSPTPYSATTRPETVADAPVLCSAGAR